MRSSGKRRNGGKEVARRACASRDSREWQQSVLHHLYLSFPLRSINSFCSPSLHFSRWHNYTVSISLSSSFLTLFSPFLNYFICLYVSVCPAGTLSILSSRCKRLSFSIAKEREELDHNEHIFINNWLQRRKEGNTECTEKRQRREQGKAERREDGRRE